MLGVRVLGAISLHEDNHLVPLTRPLERRLLAILAVHRGMPVLDEQIIEHLWPRDAPSRPRPALQTSISRLRRVMGSEAILRQGEGYRLADEVELDSEEFEALVEGSDGSLDLVSEALALWTADSAYLDFRYDDFARGEADRLHELRLVALERFFALRLDAGDMHRLIPDLEALLKENPLREGLYEILMTALYRAGRQADALRAFRVAADQLAEMGLMPSASLARLEEDVLLQSSRLDIGDHARSNNIPSRITSIIGRHEEIENVTREMDSSRLLTLTGPAGVGKTTLAFEAARQTTKDRRPAWWLDLTKVRKPERLAGHLVESLASALQREFPKSAGDAALIELIGDGPMLLIFDNCEHVVDEAARIVRRVLEQCPRATVIATSRERLALAGERLIAVAPLPIYPASTDSAGPDQHSEDGSAVQLFVERARDAAPAVELGGSLDDVARLCRTLDGLPLAIELAAARMATLSVRDMLDQLEEHHSGLGVQRGGDERHASLDAAIGWSYDLLDSAQQERLQILATVSGPFTREDVARLGGASDPTVGARIVAELQERSLVVPEASLAGARSFRLLFTVREYARSRAADQDRTHRHAQMHAECFRMLALEAEPLLLCGSEQIDWYGRVRESLPDFQRAIDHFVEVGDHEAALAVAGGIGQFFGPTRRHLQGYELMRSTLREAGDTILSSTARVHRVAAQLAVINPGSPAFDRIPDHVEAAREAGSATGDHRSVVEAEFAGGVHRWMAGDPEGGISRLHACHGTAAEAGFEWAERYALLFESVARHSVDRSGVAEAAMKRATAMAAEYDDDVLVSFGHLYLGCLMRDTGHYRESADEYRQADLMGGRFGLPLHQPVAATGVLLARWLDGDVEGARAAEDRALRLADVWPVGDIASGFVLLLNEPDAAISPADIEAGVARVFSHSPEERPVAASRLVLEVYEGTAERIGAGRLSDVHRALDLVGRVSA